MNEPSTATSAQSARERLAQTRRDLLRHMHLARGDQAPPPEDAPSQEHAASQAWPGPPPGGSRAHDDRQQGNADSDSLWQGLRQSASAWWRGHPAHLALEVAQPVFEKYARAQPLKVMGICAAAGAALVLIRPWRLISLTGLLVAGLKSAQMSSLASAVLRSSTSRPGAGRPPP